MPTESAKTINQAKRSRHLVGPADQLRTLTVSLEACAR